VVVGLCVAGLTLAVLVSLQVHDGGISPSRPSATTPPMVKTPTPGPAPCPGPGGCTVTGATGLPVQVMAWSWTTELDFYQPPSPLAAAPPGTLVRIQHLAPGVALPPHSVGWRILYHSESPSGSDVAVSGVVVAPAGPAPAGGFPLVSFAHGTTGLASLCAPSRYTTFEIPTLATFIRAGDAVVATDYPGLGTPGPEPYAVGVSEGRGVLDAARAAREVPGLHIGDRVVVYGYSQGGQAALFAGQLAPGYAPSLDLAGVVAEAPAVDLPGLVTHILSTPAFNGLFVTLAVSWSEVYPELPLTSLLTPAAIARDGVTASGCENQIQAAYAKLPSSRLATPGADPDAPGADPTWRLLLAANSPGGAPIGAPVLVLSGSADQVIPPSLTDRYVARACTADHDRITHDLVAGADHGTITTRGAAIAAAYVAARFAGRAVPPGCRTATVAGG
jgi:pimeloyl-ACP methyl ester carboxylesterase